MCLISKIKNYTTIEPRKNITTQKKKRKIFVSIFFMNCRIYKWCMLVELLLILFITNVSWIKFPIFIFVLSRHLFWLQDRSLINFFSSKLVYKFYVLKMYNTCYLNFICLNLLIYLLKMSNNYYINFLHLSTNNSKY